MRGQTTLDFAIGVAIFIAVLLFAFGFVPGILEPFEIRGEEGPAVSDRMADTLGSDMLGSPETPYVLDRHCTVAFFNDSVDSGDCSFDNGDGLRQRFNLSSFQRVNVTIVNSSAGNTAYCWDGDDHRIAEESDCDPGEYFTIGGVPTEGQTTITARRTVTIDGEIATMRVVVW